MLGSLGNCKVILKDNALFPWIILVPEVEEGVEDLHQLDAARYEEVLAAVRQVSLFVSAHFHPEKLNVACIGNQVRQMHIHVVGRFLDDPAWPGTVWAFDGKQNYSPEEATAIRAAAESFLKFE